MYEKIALILRLYEEKVPLGEIQERMGLKNGEFNMLLRKIREMGYNTTKSYSSDGDITVKLNTSLNFKNSNTIRISVKDRVFRALFISDLHIGSIYSNPRIIKKIYEYALAHDIHIIFNGGDMIENIYPDNRTPLRHDTLQKQLDSVVRDIPHDPHIIMMTTYGNHDHHSVLTEGFDVARYIEDRRYDIVSLGYGASKIQVKDDVIGLVHEIKNQEQSTVQGATITYKGHSHKSKMKGNNLIYIPSACEHKNPQYEFEPLIGFIDAEFIFFDKKIAKINNKQLAIIGEDIRLANEEAIKVKPDFEERPRTYGKKKN